MLPVAILAGGLATRLYPNTHRVPKSLLEVAGKPFIFRQLGYLNSQGVDQVVLCVGHLGEMIREVVGDGSQFGLDISYSFDGSSLLGTGGALKLASSLLGRSFFVLYGDSFLPIDFRKIEREFLKARKLALMTVLNNQDRWDKSNVLFRAGELLEYNKYAPRSEMKFIDYGLGVLSSHVLEAYPNGQAFDLAEVYHNLSINGQLAGFEVHERFYEIGSPAGLKETETYFLKMEMP